MLLDTGSFSRARNSHALSCATQPQSVRNTVHFLATPQCGAAAEEQTAGHISSSCPPLCCQTLSPTQRGSNRSNADLRRTPPRTRLTCAGSAGRQPPDRLRQTIHQSGRGEQEGDKRERDVRAEALGEMEFSKVTAGQSQSKTNVLGDKNNNKHRWLFVYSNYYRGAVAVLVLEISNRPIKSSHCIH